MTSSLWDHMIREARLGLCRKLGTQPEFWANQSPFFVLFSKWAGVTEDSLDKDEVFYGMQIVMKRALGREFSK